MKKIIFIILMIMLVLASSISSFGATAIPNDVAGTKYETAVSALMTVGIVKGYPDGTYKPLQSMNRAEACKMIVTSLNPTLSMTELSGFNDTTGYAWASQYIAYAAKTGIVNGYGDNSFKPGNLVTLNEMVTMIIRALGYSDSITSTNWPTGFLNKARDLGILAGIDLNSKYADRGTVALLFYNAFILNGNLGVATDKLGLVISKSEISGSNNNKITIISSDGITSSYEIAKSNLAYANLESGNIVGFSTDTSNRINTLVKKDSNYAYNKNFNEMSTYNSIPVDTDVVIFTFGTKSDFAADKVKFTAVNSEYGFKSIRLMQNVTTSANYVVENGKITAMIVPTDVGFSGRAYGMIQKTGMSANYDGDAVASMTFLLGKNTLQILTDGKTTMPAIDLGSGEVYELYLRNGVATNIATTESLNPTKKNSAFVELTSGFVAISEKGTDYVIVNNGSEGVAAIEYSADTVVYEIIYDGDIPDGYNTVSTSSLRDGEYIRAFDVTDDDNQLANIIVIDKEYTSRR